MCLLFVAKRLYFNSSSLQLSRSQFASQRLTVIAKRLYASASTRLMRGKHLSSTRLLFLPLQRRNAPLVNVALSSSWPVNAASAHQARGLANIRDDNICFVGSSVQPAPPIQTVQDSQEPPQLPGQKPGDGRPPDERTLNLGKSKRIDSLSV